MKKLLFVFFFLFAIVLVTKNVYSQKLYFCEGVSDNGKPQNPSSTFNIPSGGGYFYFLVDLGYAVNCTYANYDIYRVNGDYSETFFTTYEQDGMKANWTWFWKKVTFYDSGYYRVYVYDCDGSLITSEYLTIRFN